MLVVVLMVVGMLLLLLLLISILQLVKQLLLRSVWVLNLILLVMLMLMILLYGRVGRNLTIVMRRVNLTAIILADIEALPHEAGYIIGCRSHRNMFTRSQLRILISAGSVLQSMMMQHFLAAL